MTTCRATQRNEWRQVRAAMPHTSPPPLRSTSTPLYLHASLPPRLSTSTPLYLHSTSTPLYLHSSLPPLYLHASLPPLHSTSTPLYLHSALPPRRSTSTLHAARRPTSRPPCSSLVAMSGPGSPSRERTEREA